MVKSIYIHIPFCKSICPYCDFCKMFYNEKYVKLYLEELEKEIKTTYKNEVIETIYIGGGTPSSLSITELKKLFNIIKKINKTKDCEITFESNVLDIKEELLELLKENKVNRLSIGIETINEKIQKKINRIYSKELIKEKINLSLKYINNINVDLMYGFDKETINILKEDLNFLTSLDISHISIYSLQLEENTKFYIDKEKRIDDDLDFEMYKYICNYLKNKGFNHYEISNFSKEGKESKHNLTYWNNEEYYGFGLGSSSFINNKRYQNTRSLNKYLKSNYISWVEEIDKEINMEYEMILGLRKTKGIKKKYFYNKFNCEISDIFDIIDLINKGLIIDDGENIYISEDNLYISNYILNNFIGDQL